MLIYGQMALRLLMKTIERINLTAASKLALSRKAESKSITVLYFNISFSLWILTIVKY